MMILRCRKLAYRDGDDDVDGCVLDEHPLVLKQAGAMVLLANDKDTQTRMYAHVVDVSTIDGVEVIKQEQTEDIVCSVGANGVAYVDGKGGKAVCISKDNFDNFTRLYSVKDGIRTHDSISD